MMNRTLRNLIYGAIGLGLVASISCINNRGIRKEIKVPENLEGKIREIYIQVNSKKPSKKEKKFIKNYDSRYLCPKDRKFIEDFGWKPEELSSELSPEQLRFLLEMAKQMQSTGLYYNQ